MFETDQRRQPSVSWAAANTHTGGGRDWIQIRCLTQAELHGNQGFLGDRRRVDPSLPTASALSPRRRGGYGGAEGPSRRRVAAPPPPEVYFPAVGVTSLFNGDIFLRECCGVSSIFQAGGY